MTIKIADKVEEVEKLLKMAEKFDIKITENIFSCILTSVYNSDFVLNNEMNIQGFN
jgi:hypothetical protein